LELETDVLELAAIASALLRHFENAEPSCASDRAAGSGGGMRNFVVVELGAGFGRWSLETVLLAKRLGITARAICVEAEPSHVDFLRDAFLEMGVPDEQLRLVEAAIGEVDGEGWFPHGNAREWWGQALSMDETAFPGYWHSAEDAEVYCLCVCWCV